MYSLVPALPAISMIEARKGLGTRLWIMCTMKKHAHIIIIENFCTEFLECHTVVDLHDQSFKAFDWPP